MQPMVVVLPAPLGPRRPKDLAGSGGERDVVDGGECTVGFPGGGRLHDHCEAKVARTVGEMGAVPMECGNRRTKRHGGSMSGLIVGPHGPIAQCCC